MDDKLSLIHNQPDLLVDTWQKSAHWTQSSWLMIQKIWGGGKYLKKVLLGQSNKIGVNPWTSDPFTRGDL